ncbi:hypothetical protein ES702_06108 [subsurface metagenome]
MPSEMYQTRTCTYGCLPEEQCDPRDLDPPTPSVDPDCGDGETIFDFSWNAPDAANCPVSPIEYYWKVDDELWSEPQTETSVSSGPFAHGDRVFYVKARDTLGRESSSGSISFSVDAQPPGQPELSADPVYSETSPQDVSFSWGAVSDEGCGSSTIESSWKVDSGDWSSWQAETEASGTYTWGVHVFSVKARDGAGNESEEGSVYFGIGKQPFTQGCFNYEGVFLNFAGTAKDEACAGVTDVDISIKRNEDNFCWDGTDWRSAISCPIWLDTDFNNMPPVNEGQTISWSRTNNIPWPDVPWPEEGNADGRYQICSVAEDAFDQKQGPTDSCNTFVYDNTLPTCGNTIELSDAETGGWITTSTEHVLVETAGFWDENCVVATYDARILRSGLKVWPEGEDWYSQIDTICTTTGGYPNNHYIFRGLPAPGTIDGDQLEICFDVIDCADNRATQHSVEDCPIMEFVPGLCKIMTIFNPAWLQTKDGNVHVNTTVSKSIFSDIPTGVLNPYFSLGTPGNVSAGGGMGFGAGSVSLKGWRVDNYSGSLYLVEKKGYDYFWQLFGSPIDAPELVGDTGEACEAKRIGGINICYNPGDLTLEPPGASQTPIRFDGETAVFVEGNLQVNRRIEVKAQSGSVVIFFVKGDLNISWDLESDDVDDPILEGVYVVDGRIYSARIAENAGKECIFDEETGYSDPSTCEFDHNNDQDYPENEWPGKRLVTEGTFITYGGFWLTSPYGRNLKGCTETRLVCNKNTPAELFIYRPDFFENLPDSLKEQFLSWEEVAP